ncbi:helix-loop-helix DNA-binding domain-containing protein [Phascolomyces articulosus]|uniref:Helix-loop-helix DNA-binding domain-containing protein n=1 Tax=Phascolomyces articulosus TaxID=60185 RepID=A0AAD5JZQ2_9FUNG|nr:helix-loop-helix DNA-binding domain-containing protein [Phascolomyces articulosus]
MSHSTKTTTTQRRRSSTATTVGTNRRQSSTSASSSSSTSSTSSQHSLIEKRRRERINDKIQKLKEIIPTCNPFSEQQPIRGPSFHQPLHKLAILEAAIDYIQQMHQTLLETHPPPLLMNDPKIARVIEHARQCQLQQEKEHQQQKSS